MLLGDVEMEISSSDVSLSFLLLYNHPSISLFPFPQSLSHTHGTAWENSCCFLPKSTLSKTWSYWSIVDLLYVQSLSGEEIIPDFWIMKNQVQNNREWRSAREGPGPVGFLLSYTFCKWEVRQGLCTANSTHYCSSAASDCGSAKEVIVSQSSDWQKFPHGNPLQPLRIINNHKSGQEWAVKPVLVSRDYFIPWLCCLPSTYTYFLMTI